MKIRGYRLLCAGALMCAAVPQQLWAANPVPAQSAQSEEQMKAQRERQMNAIRQALHPQSGTIAVPGTKASFNLGGSYYFLPATDAKRVLTEAWGNPPESVGNVLGMIFPAGKQFDEDTWGAVIEYEDTGHVSDKDAASEDYDKVLADMKSSEAEDNKQLKEQGYATSQLIGWAQAPSYDPNGRTLIWARNIKFEGTDENTLNYDVRTLGRTGVLSLNMVDRMSHLPQVREAAVELGKTVSFDPGARYADFDAKTDHVADYGLAGLVAAGAGVLVAKKLGFMAVILLFLKKGIAILIAAGVGAVAWFRRKFRAAEE